MAHVPSVQACARMHVHVCIYIYIYVYVYNIHIERGSCSSICLFVGMYVCM